MNAYGKGEKMKLGRSFGLFTERGGPSDPPKADPQDDSYYGLFTM